MILSNYNFPTLADQQTIEELGATSSEQCRTVVVQGDGSAAALAFFSGKEERRLRLRHPKPITEIQAVQELEEAGEGHRVVELMIYVDKPTLEELGFKGDPDLRVSSHQNWYFRIPALEGHIVGQVQVLELVKGCGGTFYAHLKDSLEAHHISPSGEMNVIEWAGSDAWVRHLQRGGFRRRG